MAGFGGSIKLTGESAYKKAIAEITNNLTVLSSEMKVVTSLYDRNDTSTQNLSKQNQVLTKRLDEQNKKLAEAKRMLNEATTAENTNAQTIAKWQTEVNKAQAEVNKTTRELEKNTKQIKENDKAVEDLSESVREASNEADKAGNGGFTVFKGILANLGTQVITGVINGMKQLASAIIDIGKQAIASYADYEQLVGGVETLFKDSAGAVQQYANNAYKTAGLSANEYMETVTSFSASLLQSLGQDTEKASKYADQAIIDMADNANKMGTDMSMIQNAYQGFAKQNYTMLDNLKLGYGGTKTEMERLIADANKVKEANGEMADLSISSFADVTEAIHIIQTEMGITGTTAKEASETITGSISAMKSAWSNLLTGIADENSDFDGLINQFVDSVMTVMDNLMPRITQTMKGMGDLAMRLLTDFVPQILTALPAVMENAVPMIINPLVEMLPLIADTGVKIILALVNGIGASLPNLVPAIIQAVITITQNLIYNLPLILDAGIELIKGLAQGLIDAIPYLIDAVPELIQSLITNLYLLSPKILEAGIQLTIQLSIGLIRAIPQLVAKIPEIISAIIKGFTDSFSNFRDIGKNILKGIGQGMKDGLGALWDTVKNIGKTVTGWFKDIFKIHSPSQLFADEIGANLALGIGEGFKDTMGQVNTQMAEAVNTDWSFDPTQATGPATAGAFAFDDMVDAFKEALKQVKIELDDEVAGKFVTDTVERVVYN